MKQYQMYQGTHNESPIEREGEREKEMLNK